MKWLVGGMLIGLGICVAIAGCGPSVARSDLGKTEFEVPEVPGADEPYQLPGPPPPSKRSMYERMAPPGSPTKPPTPETAPPK